MSTAFDRLNDDSNFDETGTIKPIEPANDGASGTNEPPAAKAETTAAIPPPPPAKSELAADKATVETKTDETPAPAKTTEDGTQQTAKPDEEETENSLKAKFTKPEDKAEEWRIRAYRDGQKTRKALAPIQSHLDKIGSTERASRGLDFAAVFGEPDQPIADAVTKMTALSSSRTQELRDYLYNQTLDTFPDNVVRDLLEDDNVTVAELKEALQVHRGGTKTAGNATPQKQATNATTAELPIPEGMDKEEWEDFKIDYPEIYKAMQAGAAAQTSAPETKTAEPTADPKVTELESKVKTFEDKEREAHLQTLVTEIDAEGQKIHTEVFSVVHDRLRELGLDTDAADDERTTKVKTKTRNDITAQAEAEFEGPNGPNGWEDWTLCSEEQKENRKLEAKIITLLAKRDFTAARDYIDIMKARVDLVLDRVVDAEMDLYEAALRQPTEPNRNAGKQTHTRPEILGGTAVGTASDTSKTPWLAEGYRQPGESAFDAMSRYMQDNQALPGRA